MLKAPQKYWQKKLQKKVMHKKDIAKKVGNKFLFRAPFVWQSKKSVAKKYFVGLKKWWPE